MSCISELGIFSFLCFHLIFTLWNNLRYNKTKISIGVDLFFLCASKFQKRGRTVGQDETGSCCLKSVTVMVQKCCVQTWAESFHTFWGPLCEVLLPVSEQRHMFPGIHFLFSPFCLSSRKLSDSLADSILFLYFLLACLHCIVITWKLSQTVYEVWGSVLLCLIPWPFCD